MEYIMLILAFVMGYPIFMIFTYMLARAIFPKVEVENEDVKKEAVKKERMALVVKARRHRVRKSQRLVHA